MLPKAKKKDKGGAERFLIGPILLGSGWAAWILLLVFGEEPGRAWQALLINFLYFAPLSAGLVTWSAVVIVARGYWAAEAERLAWVGFGFLVPSFLVLIILWIGSPQWAPWHVPTVKGFWLNSTFLFLRDLVALLIFWACAGWYLYRRIAGRAQAVLSGAILIVVYSIVFSLIGYDLAMALDTHWSSAIFGAYFFISGLYNAIVFWTFLAVFQPQFGSEMRSDFGKLIITFSILSAYLFFMQLLTIWYENLPKETSYVVARMNYPGWKGVSLGLLILLYLAPVVLLLTIWARRNRFWLGLVSLTLLVGIWFQRWWLVMPDFMKQIRFGWAEVAATSAVLGLLWVGIDLVKKYLPQVPAGEEEEA